MIRILHSQTYNFSPIPGERRGWWLSNPYYGGEEVYLPGEVFHQLS